MSPNQNAENYTRRSILVAVVKWLLVLLLVVLVYPLLRFINFVTRSKPRYVKIQKILLPGEFKAEKDFILFVDDNGPRAVSRKCTHLGCKVQYLAKQDIIECPCHQSKFSRQGVRLAGPAKKDLLTFPVEKITETNEDGVENDVGYIVVL